MRLLTVHSRAQVVHCDAKKSGEFPTTWSKDPHTVMSLNVPEFVIPDAATLEEKVDLLIQMMATSLQNQAKVAKLEARVLSLEDTVKKMAKEITSMKDQNCSRHGFLHQRMNANGSDTK